MVPPVGNLVEIAQFFDPEEAFCAKGYLQSRGIDTFIQNEHHLTMAPWLRVALGGYRLQVMADSKEAAVTALNEVSEIRVAEAAADAPTEDEPASAHEREGKNWWWLPIAFLMETPFLPSRKTGLIGWFQFAAMVAFYWILIIFIADWFDYLFR